MIDFYGEKEYINFIKNCERLCRASLEYKQWVQQKREQGGWRCVITEVTLDDATIEIHHTPFTLYDLIETVMFNIDFQTTFDVCNHVMKLHLGDYVGWSPPS